MELKREDFINQYPPLNDMNKAEVKEMWKKDILHLYIHIPFCVGKCGFCYYKSVSTGNKGVPDEYVKALRKEILKYADMPEIKSKQVRSLYIGGGTPTLLSEQQMKSILEPIMTNFQFTPDFEFCSEARPGAETTLEKLEVLKGYGMNRLSLGVQSLSRDILKSNNCNHGVEEFYTVFEYARKCGVKTINTDLMSGLVDQSLEDFLDTVKGMIKLRPENVAIYKMEVYLNNSLYKKLREGSIKLASDEEEIDQVRKGYRLLEEAGYILANHFSFMSSPEHDHLQRRGVWDGEDMLGVGASAHSCVNSYMFQNESRIDYYMRAVENEETAVFRAHHVSRKEEMAQRAVLGLKNLSIDRKRFICDFGIDILDIFPKELEMLRREGFINIREDKIESTFEGALFADDIARELYLPQHKSMMLAHAVRSGLRL